MGSDLYQFRPLAELVNIFDSLRIPVKKADRKSGLYPYYGASGIADYVDSYIFDGEYLLLAEDGENLKTQNTPIAFMVSGKFWVNNHAHILQGNDYSDTRFLCYALQIADVKSYLSGSTRPKLTQGDMKRIPLFAPEKSTQRAISHILGSLDDKIELNRQMNETLESMAQAIFKSWFVDFDPVRAKAEGRNLGLPKEIALPAPQSEAARQAGDLFPDSFQDSDLGEIPKGWEIKTVGEAVQCVGGSTPSTKNPEFWNGGTNPFVTPKDMSSLSSPVLLETTRHISDAGVEKISSGRLPTGTVLLSSRAPIGYLAITEVPVSINQGIIAMICDKELPNYYVLYWTEANMDTIKSNAGGTTFAEISKSNFRPIQVIVPHKYVLEEYVQQVEPLYQQLVLNLQESNSLASLRDILLPQLISGELRIPDAEEIIKNANI